MSTRQVLQGGSMIYLVMTNEKLVKNDFKFVLVFM